MPWDIFSSMLSGWQWALLLTVPPAIVALYFLKLRREPIEVPSTFLWQRAVEDLHVNSLWQQLRQNLLLFLQLLLLALLILACLRPSWRGSKLSGDRFVFLIDTSASMSATDVEPTRLEAAKKQVDDLISQMKSGDAAMIISFSDRARVEQPFTTNRRLLRRRLGAIKPTQRTSDLSEALRVAAGLANPGRSGDAAAGDDPAADALPADMYILSDGGMRTVPEFSWGNLNPIYVSVGEQGTANVAITALGVSRNPTRTGDMQAFVRVENFSDVDATVQLSLHLDGNLLDASAVPVPANGIGGTEFSFDSIDQGALHVTIDNEDALMLDNVAHAGINEPNRIKVLLLTPGNDALQLALATEDASRLGDLEVAGPDHVKTKEYKKLAEGGAYDLIVFDQCVPEEMPSAHTLFVGRPPPAEGWNADPPSELPQIIDVDVSHPLMKYLDFGNVRWIIEGRPLKGPPGHQVLIDSDAGPLCVIAPRDGFEDVVFGFELLSKDKDGNAVGNTDWPLRLSFPLFIRNLLTYVGGSTVGDSPIGVQPGQQIVLRTAVPVDSVQVKSPVGRTATVPRTQDNTYVFNNTDELGIYEIREGRGADGPRRFAVNLFDSVESDLRPRTFVETAWNKVEATAGWEPTRREAWRWILLVALFVLLAEWYIYNRRVYI